MYQRTALGKKPAFLEKDNPIALGTAVAHRRLVEAIRNDRSYLSGALDEYFEKLLSGLGRFSLKTYDVQGKFNNNLWRDIIQSIDDFQPYRNELVEVFTLLARYKPTEPIAESLHHFFEGLYSFVNDDINSNSARIEKDNFKFFIQELFLCCNAAFLKKHRFHIVQHLLSNKYFVIYSEMHPLRKYTYGYNIFRNKLESLEDMAITQPEFSRGKRPLQGRMLHDRCVTDDLNITDLMQADFILYIRQRIGDHKNEYSVDGHMRSYGSHTWYPVTMTYFPRFLMDTFEVIQRAENKQFLDKLLFVFGVDSLEELKAVSSNFQPYERRFRLNDITSEIDCLELLRIDKLGIR